MNVHKITLSRGTQIKLSGAPEQIEGAREKIELILQYLERNGHMSPNYFEQILGGDDERAVDNFMDRNPNDVLVFGPNGKTVRARTANQKRMVTGADKNDILFAIGPAGTGKTYTAVALAVRALKNKQVKKIILTRPAVEAGESLGFLPGDLAQKVDGLVEIVSGSEEEIEIRAATVIAVDMLQKKLKASKSTSAKPSCSRAASVTSSLNCNWCDLKPRLGRRRCKGI